MKARLLLAVLVLSAMLHAQAEIRPPVVRYVVHRLCDTDPLLRIDEVCLVGDTTVITLTYANTSTETVESLRTAPPGDPEAYYIRDPLSEREYQLLSVRGLTTGKTAIDLKPGEEVRFTLTFQRIPMQAFQLLEGHSQKRDVNYWNFHHVFLRSSR